MKQLNIKIFGKVQGVFFRASTKTKAKELGIKGFVRNESDGSVFVSCEGEDSVLETFVNWLKTGPPQAKVDKLEIDESIPVFYTEFKIER